MTHRIYKLFFFFYTIFFVFSLTIDGVKVRASKFYKFKIISIYIFVTSTLFYFYDFNSIASVFYKSEEQNKFSRRFNDFMCFWPFIKFSMCFWVHLKVNQNLAKLVEILLKLENLIGSENSKKLRIKLMKNFSIYIFLFLTILINFFVFPHGFNLFIRFFSIFIILSAIQVVFMIAFVNATLISCDFFMRYFIEIIEVELEKIIHNHKKIEFILINLNTIFEMMQIFNNSVGLMFTFFMIFNFSQIIYCVSKNEMFIEYNIIFEFFRLLQF